MPQLGSKKVRTGCERCKQRRVKCDEQMPCGSCSRRKEDCSLLNIMPRESVGSAANPALPSSNDDWILDLELMYHYPTAVLHLGARPPVLHIWQNYILAQGMKYPFLMHGLLALSALYLAHIRPTNSFRYFQSYDKHQGIALHEFRGILSSSIDSDQADALLALASTLSVSSMAKSCAQSENAASTLDSIAELFILTKGIGNVIHLAHHHSKQSPMAEMLKDQPGYPGDTPSELPMRVSSRFDAIREMLLTSELDPAGVEDCQSALTELEAIYKVIACLANTTDIETGDVSRWQVRVSMGFVRLIQARSPAALIILAYFAAAMTAIRTAWFTQGWAEYALRGISQALDGAMQHWLQWPMLQVEEKMSALGVRLSNVNVEADGAIFAMQERAPQYPC